MNFINESKQINPTKDYYTGRHYTFDKPSKYLFVWSRLLQKVISQAGTYLLTGKFHTQQTAVYKSEGGCNIVDIGDLVLGRSSCYFDTYSRDDKTKLATKKMAELISHIVLNWNPNDPVDSMLHLTAEFAGTTAADLKLAIESENSANPFGGDALADFFDWNPFSDSPIDRVYEKWCRVTFNKETLEQVEQNYSDIDLGRQYRDKINQHIRKANSNCWAMSCSPRRRKDEELLFWINTGRQTQIDGWKTQKDIQDFLNSDGKLIDVAKY